MLSDFPSRTRTLKAILVVLLVALVALAAAAPAITIPKISLNLGAGSGKDQLSSSLQLLALLTVLSIAPAILILTTAFTRIVIVFSFVRSALGTPTIPPNQVLVGLSLFLTFFVMAPTYGKVNDGAIKPYMAGKLSLDQAVDRASEPMKDFMLKCTYQSDLTLFLNIRNEHPATRKDLSLVKIGRAHV